MTPNSCDISSPFCRPVLGSQFSEIHLLHEAKGKDVVGLIDTLVIIVRRHWRKNVAGTGNNLSPTRRSAQIYAIATELWL